MNAYSVSKTAERQLKNERMKRITSLDRRIKFRQMMTVMKKMMMRMMMTTMTTMKKTIAMMKSKILMRMLDLEIIVVQSQKRIKRNRKSIEKSEIIKSMRVVWTLLYLQRVNMKLYNL